MDEIIANVNWIAVIVGAVASFILGWAWYSPMLFGVKWAEGVGAKLGGGKEMPAGPLIVQALGTFLLAWVVGVTAKNEALLTFILIVVTVAVLVYAGGMFSGKSAYARTTEAGFVLAMGAVMFAAQAIL